MTLQRLLREDPASVPSSAPQLRAKVIHDRLRSVPYAARAATRPPRGARTHESGRHQALLGELTRVISGSLDYTRALRDVCRIVSQQLGCGCVFELLERGGPVRLAHQPLRIKPLLVDAFAPLVADVVARNRSAAATCDEALSDDRRGRLVAERARHESGADWVVCEPLSASDVDPVGAVILFGGSSRVAVPHDLAREIAEHTAVAIRNGRLYRAALVAAHERQHILSLVAHELKNPLGVILMGAAQALDGNTEEAPCTCRRRELEAIQRSAKRMKKLVGDLLDLASIDAGRLSVQPASCNLSTVIAGVVRDLGATAGTAGVDLLADRLAELPMGWVDPDRLSQVLVNLVSNAIKFTPRGGHVRVRAARVDEDELIVAVEDSGRGIEPDDLGRIFDQFWQASDTASMGSGLGLAISKSIVELSGGRIWAQSTVGVGTTIYFTLPAAAGA